MTFLLTIITHGCSKKLIDSADCVRTFLWARPSLAVGSGADDETGWETFEIDRAGNGRSNAEALSVAVLLTLVRNISGLVWAKTGRF